MNYPKILYFTCLLSGMILFGCNNSSNSNSSDEKTAEEIGKAILHTNLTDISPISVEELEAWLPKTLGGMSLTSSALGSMSHSGISGIAATYGNPYEKSVKLLLTDCAGEQASAMGLAGSFRRLMNQNIDENTEMGYQKTVTNKGVKAIENYNSDTDSYEIANFFGDRFSINLSSTRISREAAWEAFHSLPLDKLLN